ncbi:B- and T-lymphocyte attenuator-like isoform X2 [Acipenser ruthenus]|uniref:B- and T-lymphocyte attenuator-like isoform X2 n=1 Tax=Acipenser ruthenus TaxID=7906 RepID=UPI0027419C25|nr:B- and T-lymphocyte attenuator-like isoform X2 [Acipenser ruthenus]
MEGLWLQERRVDLAYFLLLILCIEVKGQDSACSLEVRVPRNTAWNVSVMKTLTINCTVNYCEEEPQVTWCKVLGTDCKPLNATVETSWNQSSIHSAVSFLTFSNISSNDSGQYRCKAVDVRGISSVGHSITVSVNNAVCCSEEENVPTPNMTTSGAQEKKPTPQNDSWLTYIYICVGVLILIIIVALISFFCIQGHRVTPKSKEAMQNNQKHKTPKASRQSSTAASLPSRPSDHIKPAGLAEESVYDNDHHSRTSRHTRVSSSRGRASSTNESAPVAIMINPPDIYYNQEVEDENCPIVYAALRHAYKTEEGSQHVRLSAASEEQTEYAAIRVKNGFRTQDDV